MDVHHLIRMANDIGDFFAAEQPQPGQAAAAVLNHIKRYWDPRMRAQIVAHYREGGEGLDGFVRDAIARLAAEAQAPKTQA